MAQRVKNMPKMQEMQETWVPSLGWEDPLEEEMATHSNILAWKIPWTEKPGGLQPKGSQRVEHNWVTKHAHREKVGLLIIRHGSPRFLKSKSSSVTQTHCEQVSTWIVLPHPIETWGTESRWNWHKPEAQAPCYAAMKSFVTSLESRVYTRPRRLWQTYL